MLLLLLLKHLIVNKIRDYKFMNGSADLFFTLRVTSFVIIVSPVLCFSLVIFSHSNHVPVVTFIPMTLVSLHIIPLIL